MRFSSFALDLQDMETRASRFVFIRDFAARFSSALVSNEANQRTRRKWRIIRHSTSRAVSGAKSRRKYDQIFIKNIPDVQIKNLKVLSSPLPPPPPPLILGRSCAAT